MFITHWVFFFLSVLVQPTKQNAENVLTLRSSYRWVCFFIWTFLRNVTLHHLLTNGSSFLIGCCPNKSSSIYNWFTTPTYQLTSCEVKSCMFVLYVVNPSLRCFFFLLWVLYLSLSLPMLLLSPHWKCCFVWIRREICIDQVKTVMFLSSVWTLILMATIHCRGSTDGHGPISQP